MLTAAVADDFAALVADQTAGLVDLLVLINDNSPLLGGALAARLDGLVRARIVELIDGAADAAAFARSEAPP